MSKVEPFIRAANSTLRDIHANPQITRFATSADELSIRNTTRFVRARSKAEIKEFTTLFIQSFLDLAKKTMKKPNSFLNICSLKISGFFVSVIHNIEAKMATVEIIKNSSGKIIGGFSFGIQKNCMHIGQVVLDPSKRNTPEGRELLISMGKRIKELATHSDADIICCDVLKTQKSVIRLYEKAGFTVNTAIKLPGLYRLEAPTGKFGNGYL